MRDFDEFDDETIDETEAWHNTLVDIGTGLIDQLFERRATYWPTLDDRAFLPVLDMVREEFEQFIGPEQLLTLWDHASWVYHERYKEKDARVKAKQTDLLLQEALPKWYQKICHVEPPKPKPRKKNRKK